LLLDGQKPGTLVVATAVTVAADMIENPRILTRRLDRRLNRKTRTVCSTIPRTWCFSVRAEDASRFYMVDVHLMISAVSSMRAQPLRSRDSLPFRSFLQ
jgi:hypothetical protein